MKKMMRLTWLITLGLFMIFCGRESGGLSEPGMAMMNAGDPIQSGDKGIGPVRELKLGPVDRDLADRGKRIFGERCASCHALDKDTVGPALGGVLKKDAPEFVMNMILNTAEMTANNETIKKQVARFGMPMPSLGLAADEGRAVLEYLRTTDE